MAYRRRQGLSRSSTFKEEILRPPEKDDAFTSSAALPHRSSDPRLDSFRSGALHSSFKNRSKGSATSLRSANEQGGFWGVLARKAKDILEDEVPQQSNASTTAKPETIRFSTSNQFTGIQVQHQYESSEDLRKMDSATLRIGSGRLTSSLNRIGDSIVNALEEDKKTQDTIQKPHRLQNRRMTLNSEETNQDARMQSALPQRTYETQIQASRDVAIATAAKVKQLVRELKTVKAELAFAKERCSQLEEENKKLREAHEKGDHPTDDDMIRVQLETLLAEKGRLAHENSVYARENRYLREIVEFHQLSMQDVVYFDEDIKLSLLPTEDSPEASQNTMEASSPSSSRSA